MHNKKIKCLILIIALFITRSQLYVFSETTSSCLLYTSITLLYEELRKKGANPRFMKAKMAGGAHMFNFNNSNNALTIGEKNVKVCKETLFKLRIPIISSDVLGSCGRTIIFDTTTNKLKIKSVGKNEKFI